LPGSTIFIGPHIKRLAVAAMHHVMIRNPEIPSGDPDKSILIKLVKMAMVEAD
jgi:hypothetical protein